MTITTLLESLADSPLGTNLAESPWLFPMVETLHVLTITLVVGSIALVDLRLIGWVQRERRVSDIIRELLPWTWAAFAVAVPSGAILFCAKPLAYFDSLPMRLKFAALVAAGLNMLVFHLVTQRSIATWETGRPPTGARVAGVLSLLLWIGVVTAGRWIGFVK